MTLNVSLRVPDGIVLASDSLSTQMKIISNKINVAGICPSCSGPVEIKDVSTPNVPVPSSSWPYTQKLFSLHGQCGFATSGMAHINNRSIYNHAIEIGASLATADGDNPLDYYQDKLSEYFWEQFKSEAKMQGLNLALQPDNWAPVSFHLVGFNRNAASELVAETRFIFVGKLVAVEKHDGLGCSVTGDCRVVNMLWKGGNSPNYAAFSLQDAIDYAKFLIRTTSDFQRFSGEMPTVGGDIDIALITQHRGFQWIAQKQLYRVLDAAP